MKRFLTNRLKVRQILALLGLVLAFTLIYPTEIFAQKRRIKPGGKKIAAKKPVKTLAENLPKVTQPKVTQIDDIALKNLLKREGEAAKPLLINFWATWCDPCREEFPDLVKLDAQYKGRIDFITISLDPLSEIKGDVPKFLAAMKAEMPAYLLKSPSEEASIALVSKQWQGGLPFTILFDAKGASAYSRQGKVKLDILRSEIEKLIVQPVAEK